jgi:hypothetical protein
LTKKRFALIAGTLAVLLAGGGVAYALGSRNPTEAPEPVAASIVPSPTATGTAEPQARTKATALGVFRSTSPEDVQKFSDWLGRDVDYVIDFSRRGTWDEIANPYDQLQAWQDTGYRVVYGLAMLPEGVAGVSLEAGADGDYDQYYKTLAENLVKYGQGDAILRLGWEFNLGQWRWHPTDKQVFITYWRNIVKTMRSVPGAEKLEFDWNINNGGDKYDSSAYYPGDGYVDYVGLDVYDISFVNGVYPYPAGCSQACRVKHQKAAWNNALNAKYGLKFWSGFAASHDKPMSFPEWGLWKRPDGHGGGDDPYFIKRMHDFIKNPVNNVAYQAYFEFDVGSKGIHELSGLKQSGRRFQRLFGQ